MQVNNNYSNIGLTTAQEAANSKSKEGSELGQDAFLKLMTTQLSNQDPFEPMDNGDFLAQMAQFGTVNGVNELVESFDDLTTSFQTAQAVQASSLIGRNVLVEHDQAYLPADSDLVGAVNIESSADAVTLNIYDAADSLIGRVELGQQPKGLMQFNWDGTNLAGQRTSAGRYRIEVEASYDGKAEALTTMVSANVSSLTLGGVGKDMQVELEHLGRVEFGQVLQIL
ncbi:MAG: flagellar hook assembly protein FlgD [Gammaproteobacteria bacterium]|nr:flagellar hook assembly protein FlgD [Gammaproteobacteria bacterium]